MIAIPNMDKPKECQVCPIFIWCYTNDWKGYEHCPIIEIPTPHGRLIDADALETVFKDMAKCEWNQKAFPISWAYAFEDTIDKIDDAPTILDKE
jgi:hypothetical protein